MSLRREATKAPPPPSVKVSKRTETGLSFGSHTRGGETAWQRPQEGSGTRTPPLLARPRSGCVFTRCPPPADRKLFSIAPTTDPSLSARVHHCTDAPRRLASTCLHAGLPLAAPDSRQATTTTSRAFLRRTGFRCHRPHLLVPCRPPLPVCPPPSSSTRRSLLPAACAAPRRSRLAGCTTACTPTPASSALLPVLATSRSPPPRRLLRPSNPAAAASDPAVEGRIRPQAMPEIWPQAAPLRGLPHVPVRLLAPRWGTAVGGVALLPPSRRAARFPVAAVGERGFRPRVIRVWTTWGGGRLGHTYICTTRRWIIELLKAFLVNWKKNV